MVHPQIILTILEIDFTFEGSEDTLQAHHQII
jgi:hypothetical protein